jgi:hypothetical protein
LWYGYCYENKALAEQKNYYFRIYMLFSLDIAGGYVVNVRKVSLHPYQDPSFETKGGGAGISSFSFNGPYIEN